MQELANKLDQFLSDRYDLQKTRIEELLVLFASD
jgi:hypothetical protein